MTLENQVAVITGANRGIGRGIALEMAKAGADIVVNYRSHAGEAEDVAAEVRKLGRRALVFQADVSDRAAIDRMMDKTVEELGRIDVVVANAAYSIRKPFLELANDDLEKVLAVTLMGVFNAAQSGARHMVHQGNGGAILIISSVHAFIPVVTSLPYNTCKAGINHMSSTIAKELAPHRIRCNIIEPGWIDTPGERAFISEEELAAEAKKLTWGRLGTIEEIGKCAAFMCSKDGEYITGANFRVDGGFWLNQSGG